MGKRKIYSKLFKFAPSKSWSNSSNGSSNKTVISYFYNEYTLEFVNGEIFWNYNVYNGRSTYSSNLVNYGVVTTNKLGKLLFTVVGFIVISIGIKLFSNIVGYYPYIISLISAYLLSFIEISIFNFSIYRSFRKAQYAANNVNKILRKEEEDKLNSKVINIVNNAIAKDPKLSRKMKLNKLNKKHFWEKLFNRDKEEIEGESSVTK